MASNRGVAYIGPGLVEVQSIDFPKAGSGKSQVRARGHSQKLCLRIFCGSDQHMVRGPHHPPERRSWWATKSQARSSRRATMSNSSRRGDLVSVSVQHRLRSLQQLPGARNRRVPSRKILRRPPGRA